MKKIVLTALAGIGLAIQAVAAPTIDNLSDTWDWTFTSLLKSTAGFQQKKAYVEIKDPAAGTVSINFAGSYEVTAHYDDQTGLLTIQPGQFLGHNDTYNMDILLIHDKYEGDSRVQANDEPIVARVDASQIFFDPDDCLGFGNRDKGYMIYGHEMAMKKGVSGSVEIPETGWELSHRGWFLDGWHTLLALDDNAGEEIEPIEVDVELNTEVPGLYRIVNPYAAGSLLWERSVNADATGEGYIVFSVADPEFVCVYPTVYTGYTDVVFNNAGMDGRTFNYNLEGKFTTLYERTKEQVLSSKVLTETPSSYDAEKGIVYFRNIYFGLPFDMTGDYSWATQTYPSWVTMANGVGGASSPVADTDTPVYYNLQGQRIMSPVRGLPVVRISGGKSEKVIL